MAKEQIRLLDFNNGIIYRYKPNGDLEKVGNKHYKGYLRFTLNRKTVFVHRYLYEKYHNVKLRPDEEINHINHNRSDNRIDNLEVVNHQKNSQYRENKTTGISWHEQSKKWRVRIGFNYKRISLGLFDKFEDAVKARKDAEKLYNEFHGAKFNV